MAHKAEDEKETVCVRGGTPDGWLQFIWIKSVSLDFAANLCSFMGTHFARQTFCWSAFLPLSFPY